MENEKFTFKEKMLAFTKKHKKRALPHSIIGVVVTLAILLAANWWPLPERESLAETGSQEEESIFTASMVGDMMLGRYVSNVIDHRGGDFLLHYAQPYFDEADYVTGNLENPLLIDGHDYVPADKEIHLEAPAETVQILENAGFSTVNIANNHILDYGQQGLYDTLDVLDRSSVNAVGQVQNPAIDYQQINGITVATIGFNDVYYGGGQEGVLSATPSESLEYIKAAKSGEDAADLVIAHVHAGVEYTSTPTERQEQLMKAYVDAGADIVIGHHPHVLQSVETYNDGIIFYSLGNFIFDQGWTRTRDTALAQYHLYEDGRAEIELVPFRVHEAQPRAITGPREEYFKQRIFQQLTKDTTDDQAYEIRDGRLIFEVDHRHVVN
ncbi:CapA family protein [Geomicrobium sediminis]|uniref:Poly-gamma-glutamate synthesis protein (Capsule biosynthesis protein) n=1 Tax=Geomicrobium sediminis TaxID=1347788 RepID=A0ABS2P9F8_9BACL|nr:CapA family protein [Geomicrobium sediminis]MBM7631626.1 poly-gamma-glutamate synthesis protein (capsule biosynthesis protein) [Geomicrobium sediminis]